MLTSKFRHKKRQSDSDGREEGILAFFRGKHEHNEDKLHGQEHFDEDALRDGDTWGECRVDGLDVAGEHATDEARGAHRGGKLRREEDEAADGREGAG